MVEVTGENKRPSKAVEETGLQFDGRPLANVELQQVTQMPQQKRGDASFGALFARWARRVRRRLALRHALTGTAIGLAIAIVPAAVAWKTRHGGFRPYAP